MINYVDGQPRTFFNFIEIFSEKKWKSVKVHAMRFFCIFVCNLRQMQRMGSIHPIDAMLQFDANANAHTNIDASVNGP